jgi:hypothetical protein
MKNNISIGQWSTVNYGEAVLEGGLAERVGFEPTLEFPLNTLSKRAPSTTRPSLLSKRLYLNLSQWTLALRRSERAQCRTSVLNRCEK